MTEVPLERLAEMVGAEVEETVRAVKIALFNGVIRDTRVDTGRLRGNWQTTTGAPAAGQLDRVDEVPQGTDGGGAQAEVEREVTPYGVDYLSNNLSYAEVWEQRDGMVARNVARIDRTVKEAIDDA